MNALAARAYAGILTAFPGQKPAQTGQNTRCWKGTLYLGYGDRHDDGALQAYRTGSYVLVPANAPHFDGSYEGTIIIGTVIGPWATHYVNAAVKPAAGTGE